MAAADARVPLQGDDGVAEQGTGAGAHGAAAAAGDDAQHEGAAPPAFYVYNPRERTVADGPGLAVADLPVDGAVGMDRVALLTARGRVVCFGKNECGQLGVGHLNACEGLTVARLPWPAAMVRCGGPMTGAVRRGRRAVCSWGQGLPRCLGRSGDSCTPADVQGLPPGDPISLFDAGFTAAIVITQSDKAYGWGCNADGELALGSDSRYEPVPRHIAALSGLGLRRLACGNMMAVAETRSGQILGWGMLDEDEGNEPSPVPLQSSAGCPTYPLRGLAAGCEAVAAADAAGRLWIMWGSAEFDSAALPSTERVVRAAVGDDWRPGVGAFVVAATAEGRLWECRRSDPCRSITAAHPQLPLGLLPCAGVAASHILLIRDLSCGPRRCVLFLLAAERRGLLPGGQMRRAALVPFFIDEDFIFEEPLASGAAEVKSEGGDEDEAEH
eukprot:TRINITY_DN16557_c0_g1_i3.p1 TRINITY_DN16557_c0_g1~~TRINITY_DN16557_c0_g1_i3.p1  ORF type:complete len:467 (+),score=76.75 TRINITY_DN16557_c0_g1_i3:76-1401(+)